VRSYGLQGQAGTKRGQGFAVEGPQGHGVEVAIDGKHQPLGHDVVEGFAFDEWLEEQGFE
jgi:hypothetical protein